MSEGLPAPRMSKCSLWSLICGLLACVPVVTGVLAIVLGVMGIMKTRRAGLAGRWLAIAGIILGVMSLVIWGLRGKTIACNAMVATGYWENPEVVARDYLAAVANGDGARAAELSMGVNERKAAIFATIVRDKGAFVNVTFTVTSLDWRYASMTGMAKFSTGSSQAKAFLKRHGAQWKVEDMGITTETR